MTEKLDLEAIRREIDEADGILINAFERRLDAVLKVAEYKKANNLPVRDHARELKVIAKAQQRLQNKKYAPAVADLMENIMAVARSMEEEQLQTAAPQQEAFDVGCFGVEGSYSHKAMEEYFAGKKITRHYYSVFEDVVKAVKNGEIRYGVLPVENSSTGGITEVYDLLRHYGCYITGEKCVKIEHNLMALPGATLSGITEVYSHPQGFAQCKDFFAEYPQMKLVPYYSTSKSAEAVKESGSLHLAAVAGKQAAELYGLQILAANINNNGNNTTRFIIIANEAEHSADADKITLVIAVKHEPGSLYRVLGYFYHSGLNLTNLESRPIEGKSWEYFFHIDLMGNLADTNVQETVRMLSDNCAYFRILGNYRSDMKQER